MNIEAIDTYILMNKSLMRFKYEINMSEYSWV